MQYDPSIQNGPVGDVSPSIEADAPAAGAMAGMPMMGMGIGAGLGLLSAIGKANAREHEARAAAVQTRFSPWTRMGLGKMPEQANALGPILGYGASGAALQQGMQNGKMSPYLMGAGLPQPGATVMNPYMIGGGNGS